MRGGQAVMFRSQLYDPFVDPQRLEFYGPSEAKRGYFVRLGRRGLLSVGSRAWRLYHSLRWAPAKSVLCRVLMAAFVCLFTLDVARELELGLLLVANLAYVGLIALDGLVVLGLRAGLEDRWCSLSLLFFICASSGPLLVLEIVYGSYLSINVFRPDFGHHLDSHYKQLNESAIRSGGERFQMEPAVKEALTNRLGKYETLFCLTLMLCRLFVPQATLTWAAVSSMSEFAFNTLFDVYSTLGMCRDPRLSLPLEVKVVSVLISSGAILANSLNQLDDAETGSSGASAHSPTQLGRLVGNFYFRLLVQIFFADLPFLALRLFILFKWPAFIKIDIYYLIVKQLIIVACKLVVLVHQYLRAEKKQSDQASTF